jgi:8-oxo-dGTP pyrophosphatase MutT (NUDIX family)
MAARGGRQHIPRPPGTRPGRPAPWAARALDAGPIGIADVRAALADPPPPAGVLIDVPGARDAAVLVAMFDVDDEAHVLLTKRPETMPSHRGEIAFPGGKREPEDRTLVDAALREAAEEVGLDPAAVEVVAELDRIGTVATAFTITPFVGLLDHVPELRPDPVEVVDAFAVRISDLLLPETYREETWDLFGAPRPMAFFELPGETVWGATARILTRLLTLLTGTALEPEWDGQRPLG